MIKRTILSLAMAALAFSAHAKVRLPHIIGDNMVLQQQTEARLWGWAKQSGANREGDHLVE